MSFQIFILVGASIRAVGFLVRGRGWWGGVERQGRRRESKREECISLNLLLVPGIRELGRRRSQDLVREGEALRLLGLSRVSSEAN